MTEPKFALINEEDGLFTVEKFDAKVHLTEMGWSLPGITLFTNREEVSHLRDLIIN
jgi:hypothetical protein